PTPRSAPRTSTRPRCVPPRKRPSASSPTAASRWRSPRPSSAWPRSPRSCRRWSASARTSSTDETDGRSRHGGELFPGPAEAGKNSPPWRLPPESRAASGPPFSFRLGASRGGRAMRILMVLACVLAVAAVQASERPRARDAGVVIGTMPTGKLNAIVDVPDVRVGHAPVVEGDSVRPGVAAILPHGGNLYAERVPAALFVANGYGKLLGVTQLRELGELETPILLTCTLCVWKAADALVEWQLSQPGMERVRSLNAVVGETNDGFLNDIRSRPLRAEHVRAALESASSTNVEE